MSTVSTKVLSAALETRMLPMEGGPFGKGAVKYLDACWLIAGGVEAFDLEGLWDSGQVLSGSLGLWGAKGRVFLVARRGEEEVLLSGMSMVSRQ